MDFITPTIFDRRESALNGHLLLVLPGFLDIVGIVIIIGNRIVSLISNQFS